MILSHSILNEFMHAEYGIFVYTIWPLSLLVLVRTVAAPLSAQDPRTGGASRGRGPRGGAAETLARGRRTWAPRCTTHHELGIDRSKRHRADATQPQGAKPSLRRAPCTRYSLGRGRICFKKVQY